jgi:glycosyltransferase involved in cell wall biosynthesis
MVDVLVDDRWIGPHGIGRFAAEMMARLPGARPLGMAGDPLSPLDPYRLHRRLRRDKAEVYFTPGFNPPWRCPIPLVFCIHDLIHLHDAAESSLAKRTYYHWHVRPAARRAHRVITVSRYSRQLIREWSGLPEERIVVAPNGVGAEFTADGPRHEPGYPYLLFVGAHRPHKNIHRLLEAFARSGIAPRIRLELTGQPTPGERQQIERLSLGTTVHYRGLLDAASLAQLYRGALALVIPSLTEGFGLPAVEAMACATAVVSSNAAALTEVVDDAAITIDPYDVDALADAMRRVAEDTDLRRHLEQAGRQRAATYSWERTAQIVEAVVMDAAGISMRTGAGGPVARNSPRGGP